MSSVWSTKYGITPIEGPRSEGGQNHDEKGQRKGQEVQGHSEGQEVKGEGQEVNPEDHQVTWDEFINETTFHGVKYIFAKDSKFRRYIWLAVVFAAVGVFIGQVSARIYVFYQRKTNVAVTIRYVDDVMFPAVTICNHNNYRLTSTVDAHLYHFINDIFSSNVNQINATSYPGLEDVNTTEFVMQTAHQREDLIHGCTWHGRPCNASRDFETVLTDLGVCYTYNGAKPPLSVTSPGSKNALSLMLNVEQYEFMRGPQIDAGVKILLHDQGEVPQMKDQGFAVAPGTHTLVSVATKHVHNLPDPYGDCEEEHPVPVSNCQRACAKRSAVRMCGCHDVFMSDVAMEDPDESTGQYWIIRPLSGVNNVIELSSITN